MFNHIKLGIVIGVLVSMLLSACGAPATPAVTPSPDTPAPTATAPPPASGSPAPAGSGGAHLSLVQSELPRETAPQVSDKTQEALAAGNRAFALNLYRALREQDGNLFYSP
ncbi:MAG: hypothetical protein JXA33_16680, partial [Anaerolineae bacterium]|nr:hypothetical protein [Anaerolineae bacterium]